MNFVENEEWFEIFLWTNRTWIRHNVSKIRRRISKKRTLIHWSNGQFFLVINSQLFLLYNFSKFLYIFTLFIHPSTLNITNKTPHRPDDGSAELKRYSVDWLCFSINPYFQLGLLVVNFSSQIVGLLSIIFFLYIYIYIYIYPSQSLLHDIFKYAYLYSVGLVQDLLIKYKSFIKKTKGSNELYIHGVIKKF